jgi:hypothetical protein
MSAEASIGPTQCIRSLFSEFERVNNPIVSEYISSIPESLSDAVKRVKEELTVTNAENIISNRRNGKGYASFHSLLGTDFQVELK